MRTVITLVSGAPEGLSEAGVDKTLSYLRARGVSGLTAAVWLARGKAVDIFYEAGPPDMAVLVSGFAAQELPRTDVFVQPDDAHRRKKLLVADMDATIVQGETLDDLAAHLGLKDKIAPITARAMRGELDFEEALRARVGLLKGMGVSALYQTAAEMRFSKGAAQLVATMTRRGGAKCVLISGGFDVFTARVAATLGFWKNFGNRLDVQGDVLTGAVIPPIVDKHFKKKQLQHEAKELGLSPQDIMAVGDGANDIPMLETAGAGVGFYAKPAVLDATPHQVKYTDLTSLLFMQGYRGDEIL